MADSVDYTIVGAGLHGLFAARTFIELNPSAKIVILESVGSVGGTWCKERLYPGLTTNNLWGSYHAPDFPMDRETYGLDVNKPIPGPVCYQYLKDYADHFDVYRRIRFHCKVDSVQKRKDGGWDVHFSDSSNGTSPAKNEVLKTQKLVIATGLTSEPFVPAFEGSEQFELPIFHSKFLQERQSTIKESRRAIVLGAPKSGYDVAYAYASAGVGVDWIIRESGHGPVWMAPPFVTPLKKRLEFLVGTRFVTWFNPSILASQDDFGFIRSFLHGTAIGRWLTEGFWGLMNQDLVDSTGYEKHPETKKLKPWIPSFWVASSLSILNYPEDFYKYVRDGTIKVHVADITHLSPKTVHLSNGESLHGDALVCCTGWKHRPNIKILDVDGNGEIVSDMSPTAEEELLKKADAEIFQRFPRLIDQPVANKNYKPVHDHKSSEALASHPFRLYRYMVPPRFINDRSIAYAGMDLTIYTTTNATLQALWLNAYFSRRLAEDIQPSKDGEHNLETKDFDQDKVNWNTVLYSEFNKIRFPGGHGDRHADFVFDSIPYVDVLAKDLGLKWQRKDGVLAECFDPYHADDYKGIIDEWRVQNAKIGA